MKPKKKCNHAGCNNLVSFDVSYCTKHEQVNRKQKYQDRFSKSNEEFQKFYKTKRWERTSKQFRLKNPICVECLANGIVRKADVVDHIVELKDDWSKRLDWDNLQSLCHEHHNIKTAKARQNRATMRKGGSS